jgi:hypothetical protein
VDEVTFAGLTDEKAGSSDATQASSDVPASGPDVDQHEAGNVQPGTGGVGGFDQGGTNASGGVLGSGGMGGSIGGTSGVGGIAASGGTAGTGARGGTTATGGVLGSGGVTGSGGTVATGGKVSTGGTGSGGTGGTGSGGTGSGGTPCQPKSRDCTSTLDNNCNGTPDNQETTYCECPFGQSRHCQEHPGYDGIGICKYGHQECGASSDRTTSTWSACSEAVGPGTEVCDAAGLDENCNGQSNEGCECVNGNPVACDCGPATTCTNGKKGTCSQTKVTWYRDNDGDGHGNPAQPAQVCLRRSALTHQDMRMSATTVTTAPLAGASTLALVTVPTP